MHNENVLIASFVDEPKPDETAALLIHRVHAGDNKRKMEVTLDSDNICRETVCDSVYPLVLDVLLENDQSAKRQRL